jgi:hypothetical protein
MSGWRTVPAVDDHGALLVEDRLRRTPRPTDTGGAQMIRRRARDPWWGDEGSGAKRTRRRVQAESLLAIALAIAACGLIAAMWLRTLAPLTSELGLS